MANKSPINKYAYPLILVFFFSGFAALIYQVIWQRWLVFYTGISSVSISLIVSAFMAGLGLGYLVGGQIADKAKVNRPIMYFFVAEMGIGLFALFSKTLFYDWLYSAQLLQGSSNLQVYGLLFLLLLFPTFLMGLSLPLLSKAFDSKAISTQANFISLLYFTNTLGAAMGTFLTSFVLISKIGFEGSVLFGAVLNFACGFTALFVYYQLKQNHNAGNEIPAVQVNNSEKNEGFKWNKNFIFWAIQYTLSGFMAITFEIVWFRMIETMMKSYAVTFSIILTIYLGSMALGTFFGVLVIKKIREDKLKFFLQTQYFLYFYIIFSIAVLHFCIANIEFFEPVKAYFRSYEVVESRMLKLITFVLIPIFLMALPTFIMGFSFTLSQTIIQDKYEFVGRKVGWLQFVNIVGSTLGAWFTTLLGFNYLGSALTIKLVGLLGLIYVVVLYVRKFTPTLQAISLGVSLLVMIYLVPSQTKFWMNMGGMDEVKNFIFSEDDTAVSSIKIDASSASALVFVNGLGQSALPIKLDEIHSILGAFPSLVHPNPQHVGIIGLGSGCTLYNAMGRQESKEITCFEIIVNQPAVLTEYSKRTGNNSSDIIFADKRLNLVLRDGRKSLYESDKQYDILEGDPLRPRAAYSGNLYSIEYFTMLKSKLKKGGMAVTWVPSDRIRNGFRRVFPYVYEINGIIYLGSDSPIEFNKAEINQRITSQFSKNHFGKSDIDVHRLVESSLASLKVIQEGKLITSGDYNSDMWPKDEYQLR